MADPRPFANPRSGTAAALEGRVLVFGGEEDAGTFQENEAYDPAADSWTALASMPTRHGIGATVVDNAVYLPGGAPITGGGQQSDTNEAFTLS